MRGSAARSRTPGRRPGRAPRRRRAILRPDAAERYAVLPPAQGLWEVRSDLTGGTIARVMFCIVAGEMVLLHGFVKKTQKTPAKEIDLALKRKRELDDGKAQRQGPRCPG
jgi:phage-related protein